MTTVGAYIEERPNLENLNEPTSTNYRYGAINGKSSEGLDVTWFGPVPPEGAQVTVRWQPVAVATWEDPLPEEPVIEEPVIEEELENGNPEYGDEVEPAGPSTSEEVDEEPGQPGDFVGEEPAPGPEESEPVE